MIEVKRLTADEIYVELMKKVAPLPCQESYVRELCALVAYHCRKNSLIDMGIEVDELPYQGALIIAPTGMGKTYLLRTITKLVGIHTIVIDGSSLTHDGWKGNSLGQRLAGDEESLKDYERWKQSILFIDECDKMRFYGTRNDQGNPMENLLQLYNQGTVSVEDGSRSSKQLDVSRFTIILGGAFEGIDKIIEQRVKAKRKIGFSEQLSLNDNANIESLKLVEMEDVRKYGLLPELLGRVGSIITIDPMSREDYKLLINAEHGSVLQKYRTYFSSYGINFNIDDLAVEYISNKCMRSKMGARSINPIINDVVRKSFIEIDRDEAIDSIILSADCNGCFVYYERGNKRGKKVMDINTRPEIYFSVDSSEDLVNEMVELYASSSCDKEIIDELSAFLHLSVNYLYRCCPKSDRCFSSLIKLVRSMQKTDKDEKSTFDYLMDELLDDQFNADVTAKLKIKSKMLQNSWKKEMCGKLIQALNNIYSKMSDKELRR